MAQTAKATPDAIRAAIERLVGRGEKVTLQSVRDDVGGGSLGTIQPVLKAWREEQDRVARAQAADAEPAAEEAPSVPLRVAQALDASRAALDTVGGAVADAINIAVADERRRGRLELDTEREAWERRLADAQEQARAAEDETSQVATDAAALERERDELADRVVETGADCARLTAELDTERAARQAARAEANQHAAEIAALKETVEQAEARALAAEKAQEQAQEAERAAEGRARAADAAHQMADAERRTVIEQARAQQEKDAERILNLTAARDLALQDLAAARASAASAQSELTARIAAVETVNREQAGRLEEALAAAAEARGRLAGETARAEVLGSRLAGETTRAETLAQQLAAAARSIADLQAAAAPAPVKPRRRQQPRADKP